MGVRSKKLVEHLKLPRESSCSSLLSHGLLAPGEDVEKGGLSFLRNFASREQRRERKLAYSESTKTFLALRLRMLRPCRLAASCELSTFAFFCAKTSVLTGPAARGSRAHLQAAGGLPDTATAYGYYCLSSLHAASSPCDPPLAR